MAIVESISRLAANFLALLQTRLELVSVELEEESLRLFTYLICTLAAMFCLGIAILLGILLIVVIYWDTHRIGVLVSLIAAFAVASVLLGLWVRDSVIAFDGDTPVGMANLRLEPDAAQLFGSFYVPGSSKFAQIDSATGATSQPFDLPAALVYGNEVAPPFAFWGGDFWFFSTGGGSVVRYRYSTDKSFVTFSSGFSFSAVGASVSTCAPLPMN